MNTSLPLFAGFGCAYILQNEFIPGLLKIGYTTEDLHTRVSGVSRGAGVPGRFTVVYRRYFAFAEKGETAIHAVLDSSNLRVTRGREFFRIEPAEAISLVDLAEGLPVEHTTIIRLRDAATNLLTPNVPPSTEALTALAMAAKSGCTQSGSMLVNYHIDRGNWSEALPWCIFVANKDKVSAAHLLAAQILQKEFGLQESIIHWIRYFNLEDGNRAKPEIARRAVGGFADFFKALESRPGVPLDSLFDATYELYVEQRLAEPLSNLNYENLKWSKETYSLFIKWLRDNFIKAHDRRAARRC